MPNMDQGTVDSLARGIAEAKDRILAYFADPANEAAFQAWLAKRRPQETETKEK